MNDGVRRSPPRGGRARPARALLALGAVIVAAGIVRAQRPPRVLHRPIPGDLALDEQPSALPAVPSSTERALADGLPNGAGWRPHHDVDPEVQRPRSAWSDPARAMDRDTQSPPGARLVYREVFTPSIQPFKRGTALDAVDELGRMTVRDPSLRPVLVGASAPPSWAGRRRARFLGEVLVELSPSWPTPIPGVAGEQRLMRYASSDGESVEFLQDGAGNLFVRSVRAATVRLSYLLEVPDFAFSIIDLPFAPVGDVVARLPPAVRPVAPTWLGARVSRVLSEIGVDPNAPFDRVVSRLVAHFRSFRDAALPREAEDRYTELALGRVGACRHRAYALMLTLVGLGIPARFVSNEAHAWIEILVPDTGWSRVNLGGWEVELETRSGADRPVFQSGIPDPFERTEEYARQFSAQLGGGSPGDGGLWLTSDASGAGPEPVASEANRSVAPRGDRAAPASRDAGAGGGAVAPSGADSADPTELPAPDERDRRSTRLTIERVGADPRAGFAFGSGFARGSMIRVGGSAREATGEGIAGLSVELSLIRHGRVVQPLGSVATGADGSFNALLLLPADLEADEYDLRARTAGDAVHASASSD
jgi:hypothetical protein